MPSSCINCSVEGWIVSPRKSRRKSACFSRMTTSTPWRASRNPSIIPAGPPPAIAQRVSIISSILRLFDEFSVSCYVSRMKALLAAAVLCAIPAVCQPPKPIEAFFDDFTTEWIRNNPNLAASSRYFKGEEQDRFERQLTPETREYRLQRIALARKGLAELRKYDRSKLTATQRLSADLMDWQLETVVGEEPYLDYSFPLEQFGGANVGLVNTLTVNHPLTKEKDGENYVARLQQVAPRMKEAIAEAKRLSAKNMIPPKFIVEATIKQMSDFISTPPPANPFVTTFAQRLGQVKSVPPAHVQELRAQVEKIVQTEIYPAWREGISLLQSLVAKTADDAGISRFKGGTDAYAYDLHRFTTTKYTADQ